MDAESPPPRYPRIGSMMHSPWQLGVSCHWLQLQNCPWATQFLSLNLWSQVCYPSFYARSIRHLMLCFQEWLSHRAIYVLSHLGRTLEWLVLPCSLVWQLQSLGNSTGKCSHQRRLRLLRCTAQVSRTRSICQRACACRLPPDLQNPSSRHRGWPFQSCCDKALPVSSSSDQASWMPSSPPQSGHQGQGPRLIPLSHSHCARDSSCSAMLHLLAMIHLLQKDW